jgi:hypothetical protein
MILKISLRALGLVLARSAASRTFMVQSVRRDWPLLAMRDDLSLRAELTGKIEDVSNGRRAERVDRLPRTGH